MAGVDARARSQVLTGVTLGRLNMELRGAQLQLRISQGEELRECSRALVAQSEQVCERIVARRRARARSPHDGGPA
jgi:hypothetical protein